MLLIFTRNVAHLFWNPLKTLGCEAPKTRRKQDLKQALKQAIKQAETKS
jgi:hypothetical protein